MDCNTTCHNCPYNTHTHAHTQQRRKYGGAIQRMETPEDTMEGIKWRNVHSYDSLPDTRKIAKMIYACRRNVYFIYLVVVKVLLS